MHCIVARILSFERYYIDIFFEYFYTQTVWRSQLFIYLNVSVLNLQKKDDETSKEVLAGENSIQLKYDLYVDLDANLVDVLCLPKSATKWRPQKRCIKSRKESGNNKNKMCSHMATLDLHVQIKKIMIVFQTCLQKETKVLLWSWIESYIYC